MFESASSFERHPPFLSSRKTFFSGIGWKEGASLETSSSSSFEKDFSTSSSWGRNFLISASVRFSLAFAATFSRRALSTFTFGTGKTPIVGNGKTIKEPFQHRNPANGAPDYGGIETRQRILIWKTIKEPIRPRGRINAPAG